MLSSTKKAVLILWEKSEQKELAVETVCLRNDFYRYRVEVHSLYIPGVEKGKFSCRAIEGCESTSGVLCPLLSSAAQMRIY